ncbi:MAG TPA: hypothetical protein VFW00_05035 [Rhodocyclaceae bacterium]|nr:hypothetical protein [Rhodocyclaceae bacterium]
MRNKLILIWMLLLPLASATAQVSIGIGLPHVSIGINLPMYPDLVAVPGYPVYYAPGVNSNYFFYDGAYWVYQDDNWYTSDWYDGPWDEVDPFFVPAFILRVPVRYYRHPPRYFHGWRRDAPPHWDAHWGHDWAQRRTGWDHWDRKSVPARSPLPTYQRRYAGNNYPKQIAQQQSLQNKNYRYQPHDSLVRQRHNAERRGPEPRGPNSAISAPDQHETRQTPAQERDRAQHDVSRDVQRSAGPAPVQNNARELIQERTSIQRQHEAPPAPNAPVPVQREPQAPPPAAQERGGGHRDAQRSTPQPPIQQNAPAALTAQPPRDQGVQHRQPQQEQGPHQQPAQPGPQDRPQGGDARGQRSPQEHGRGDRDRGDNNSDNNSAGDRGQDRRR